MNLAFHHTTDERTMHERVCRNIENLLDDDTVPVGHVVLVASSGGLALLKKPSPAAENIGMLIARAVSVRQRRNTLGSQGADESVRLTASRLFRRVSATWCNCRPRDTSMSIGNHYPVAVVWSKNSHKEEGLGRSTSR